jgi:uncharacterized protein (UPF0332 family)
MKNGNTKLVKYRLSRANEAIEEAKILFKSSHLNACVNRLYYSCFYGVTALLAKHSLSASKHSGVRSLFNLHFVKTNKVTKKIAQTYNDLFERRQEGDYDDFYTFEQTDVKHWITDTETFITTITELIN